MKLTTWKIALFLFLLFSVKEVVAFSGKALGMGNTGVAYPQDSLSSAYNPANGACVGNRIDVLAGVAYTPSSATISNNPVPGANNTIYGRRTWNPVGAFGVNKMITENLSVGVIIYKRVFKKTAYSNSNPLAGQTKLCHHYERYAGSLTCAYSLCNCLQLGISLDLNVGTHKVGGLQNFDNPFLTVAPGKVTNRGYDWNTGVGVTLGALWEIYPELKVGLAYRPKTKMSRFHKYKGFIPEKGQVDNLQELLAGISWRALPCLTLAADAQYIWLNQLRATHNPLVVTDPTLDKLGSKHGSAFGLKSAFVLHVGADYALSDCLIVRAGYFYAKETSRKSQAFFDILWNFPMVHYLTLGATYNWDCIDIDFFYFHGFEKRIKGRNNIPPYLFGGDASYKRSLDVLGFNLGWLF